MNCPTLNDSGDQVGAEQALDGGDAVLELQLALFLAAQHQLVLLGQGFQLRDADIEVAVFELEFGEQALQCDGVGGRAYACILA